FLTGATGFLGGHLVKALSQRGHRVTCLVRDGRQHTIDALALPGVTTVTGEFTAPDSYVNQVQDHDAVINTVGIIRETPLAHFEVVHTQAPCVLFEAAARSGVRKIVQVSALGADESAQS